MPVTANPGAGGPQFQSTNTGGSTPHSFHSKVEWGTGAGTSGVATPVEDSDAARLPVGGAALGTPNDSDASFSIIGRLKKLVSLVPTALTGGGLFKVSIQEDTSGPTVGQKVMSGAVPVVNSSDEIPPLPLNTFNKTLRYADADGAQTNVILYSPAAGKKPVVTGFFVNISENCTVPVRVIVGIHASALPAISTTPVDKIVLEGTLAPGTLIYVHDRMRIATGAADEDVRVTCDDPVGGHVTVNVRGHDES